MISFCGEEMQHRTGTLVEAAVVKKTLGRNYTRQMNRRTSPNTGYQSESVDTMLGYSKSTNKMAIKVQLATSKNLEMSITACVHIAVDKSVTITETNNVISSL